MTAHRDEAEKYVNSHEPTLRSRDYLAAFEGETVRALIEALREAQHSLNMGSLLGVFWRETASNKIDHALKAFEDGKTKTPPEDTL